MYFADFQSFAQAQESAKSVVVVVDLTNGNVVTGSPVPVECYNQLMADIATADELKTAFAVWVRDTGDGSLVFIPYDKIAAIRVRFVK